MVLRAPGRLPSVAVPVPLELGLPLFCDPWAPTAREVPDTQWAFAPRASNSGSSREPPPL